MRVRHPPLTLLTRYRTKFRGFLGEAYMQTQRDREIACEVLPYCTAPTMTSRVEICVVVVNPLCISGRSVHKDSLVDVARPGTLRSMGDIFTSYRKLAPVVRRRKPRQHILSTTGHLNLLAAPRKFEAEHVTNETDRSV